MYRISSVIRLGTRYSLKNDLQMWYTPMICPQEFPLRYDFLLMIGYCTELAETRRMQSHFKQTSVVYGNWKPVGRWYLTRTSANISGSPRREMSYRLHIVLKETTKAKYLGFTVRSKLSWDSNINAVTKVPAKLQLSFAEIFQAAQKMLRQNATSA